MNRKYVPTFITLLASFPFTFLAMFLDFTYRSLFGYGLMLMTLACLSILAINARTAIPLFRGAILSTILSLLCNQVLANNEHWSVYFKPFSASAFILIVFIISLLIQLLVFYLAKKMLKQ